MPLAKPLELPLAKQFQSVLPAVCTVMLPSLDSNWLGLPETTAIAGMVMPMASAAAAASTPHVRLPRRNRRVRRCGGIVPPPFDTVLLTLRSRSWKNFERRDPLRQGAINWQGFPCWSRAGHHQQFLSL